MKNSEYILYLDMDGVLVDYNSGWVNVAKSMNIKPAPDTKEYDKKDLDLVISKTVQQSFWENLGWERGGKELWKASNDMFENIHVLTSTAAKQNIDRHKIIEAGKLVWIKKHLPSIDASHIHVVAEGVEKAKFASPLSILVDDRQTTCKAFAEAGGYSIVHKSSQYRSTIRDLKELATPMNLGEIVRSLPIMRRRFWNGE